ncbi:MAG: hypothetical protein IPO72_12060 [Saprospiraceae bacterium]|nr:hypothetical protein [Candidatus Vicinibacter affinis]
MDEISNLVNCYRANGFVIFWLNFWNEDITFNRYFDFNKGIYRKRDGKPKPLLPGNLPVGLDMNLYFDDDCKDFRLQYLQSIRMFIQDNKLGEDIISISKEEKFPDCPIFRININREVVQEFGNFKDDFHRLKLIPRYINYIKNHKADLKTDNKYLDNLSQDEKNKWKVWIL